MKTNITKENLLEFIYGEVSPERHIAIMDELEVNEELRSQYREMINEIRLLDGFRAGPSDTTIQILLEEASKSSSTEGVS